MSKKLPKSFYVDEDVVRLSQQLLGKVLITEFNGQRTAGKIVETEAYRAPEDKGSHAYGLKRTPRTETMYAEGGVAYIYLCYGLHHLFNVVTGPKDTPHAILIRAIEPLEGIEHMQLRRRQKALTPKLTAGPGVLSQALGIQRQHDATSLLGKTIWIEDHNIIVPQKAQIATPRVGIDYAEEYVDVPWRFYIKDNKWVSKKA